jgi:hypothetical protein
MNKPRLVVLASGLVGLIACFLPMVKGLSTSFWTLGTNDTFMVMTALTVALVMAAIGATAARRPPMRRWQAIVATISCLFVILRFRGNFLDLLTKGAIGGKLIGLAALVGFVASAVAVATSERDSPTS